MDTLSEQLEQLAELQKKNLEPLQNIGSTAFATFERMARKNYELMGDMVEYAVAQSRGSVEPRSPQEQYERQMSDAQAFAERMGERATEYMALAEQLREELSAEGAVSPTAANIRTAKKQAASTGGGTSPTKATSKGAKVSPVAKKRASKKRAASKAAGKKASAKKTSAERALKRAAPAAKKSTSKKTTGKKAATKKTAARKRAGRKTSAT